MLVCMYITPSQLAQHLSFLAALLGRMYEQFNQNLHIQKTDPLEDIDSQIQPAQRRGGEGVHFLCLTLIKSKEFAWTAFRESKEERGNLSEGGNLSQMPSDRGGAPRQYMIGTGCSLNIVFFPSNFGIFLNSASSAAGLVYQLPERKQRKARVQNVLKFWKKHNI